MNYVKKFIGAKIIGNVDVSLGDEIPLKFNYNLKEFG